MQSNGSYAGVRPEWHYPYYRYDSVDKRQIRTITDTHPCYTLANFAAVANATRDSTANAGHIIHDRTYDTVGRMLTSTDPRGIVTEYQYDLLDRQTVRLDAKSTSIEARTETDYDLIDQVLEVRSPRYFDSTDVHGEDAAKESWGYNARGLVTSHTESTGASAVTEHFTYDLKRRPLTHTDFAGKDWTTHYDTCCDQSWASENPVDHGSVRNMDSLGRVVHTAAIADVQDHLSDLTDPDDGKTLAESTTRYDYPDGAIVQREYTDRGELHKIKHDSTVIDTRGYDDGGRMTSSSYNNGVSESRGYNTDNTLASITFSGASIGNMPYSWDANKNKTAEEITGTMSDYGFTIPSGGYDEEDRLVSYNRTAGLTQSWDLSLVGDWNSVTTNSNTQNRTHGPAHEILTVASQNVIHEYKGNTTLIPAAARGNTLDLVVLWDFDNRMQLASEVQFGKPVISHKYDALGRRIARTQGTTTTVFVQVGQQTICDYPSGGTPAQSIYHYLYASYIDEPVMRWETAEEEAVYYHRNQQYSIVALTDDKPVYLHRPRMGQRYQTLPLPRPHV